MEVTLRKNLIRLALTNPNLRSEVKRILRVEKELSSPRRRFASDVPQDVQTFLTALESLYRRYFPVGFFSAKAKTKGLSENDIYIQFALLPQGKQTNGIIQNDPSYNAFWAFRAFTEMGLNPKIKIEMSQGGRLHGPNMRDVEKVGWRNGVGTPKAILAKFDKYFRTLHDMVKRRTDLLDVVIT